MKKIKVLFLLIVFCSANIFAQEKHKISPQLFFNLQTNNLVHQTFTAKITIKHLPHSGKWRLGFNSIRTLLTVEHAEFIPLKQGGDFYLLEFTVPGGQSNATLILHGKSVLNRFSDSPQGYFLIDMLNAQSKILPIMVETKLLSKSSKKINEVIQAPGITTIVPLPVEIIHKAGDFFLNAHTKLIYDNSTAKDPAEFFARTIQPASGFLLKTKTFRNQSIENVILLTTRGIDNLAAVERSEGYLLTVTPHSVIVRAATSAGFFYGLQTLRQLLPAEVFSFSFRQRKTWKVPCVTIRDYPRFSYRGLHLDVARHFIPVNQVKRLLDLMAFNKLNYFQWHLTDDEGWRIEIKKYPALTQKGAWRGYDPLHYQEHALFPAYGSGANIYGGYYTQQEIRDIVRYAKERHITVVPEIDMPGHARAMIMSLPNELIDQHDTSKYVSAQGYHDNVLSPCAPRTYEVIDDIIAEVAQLFPGKYLHVGGDEVPTGAWRKSCMANKFDPQDKHFSEKVQNDFMRQIQIMIVKHGKVMAGWQEIVSPYNALSKPLSVYIWNAAKIPDISKKSAQSGYHVVLCPAEKLYFDLAYSHDAAEPGQSWAGYVNTYDVYSFHPSNAKVIAGVQGQLWSEFIDSQKRLDYLAFPRVAGLAEVAWTPVQRRNWQEFRARMHAYYLPRLDFYGVQYRRGEF